MLSRSPDDKPLVWLEGEIKTPPFSAVARREAGLLLRRLQRGEALSLPHSRPMPSIASGCHELRIQDKGARWRIIYRLYSDCVVILEVFAKKKGQTPRRVVESCKARIRRFDRDTLD